MNTEIERRDPELGYTWGRADGDYFLRNPDGDLRGVSVNAMKLLEDMADGDVTRADLDGGALKLFESLESDGFVGPDRPVVRVETPDDVRFWPRLFLFVALLGAITYVHASRVPSLEEVRAALTPLGISALMALTVVGIAVHETGHYLESRRYFQPSVRIGTINGVIPAVITNTDGAWMLPRNRRRWISLAGPFAELLWLVGIVVVYYALFPSSTVLNLLVLGTISSIVLSLNPLVHGDGYWLLVDTFGVMNLKSRGIEDLSDRRLSFAATYAVASYSFGVVAMVLSASGAVYVFGPVGLVPFALLLGIALTNEPGVRRTIRSTIGRDS